MLADLFVGKGFQRGSSPEKILNNYAKVFRRQTFKPDSSRKDSSEFI